MDADALSDSLHRHLTALRCPATHRPDSGRCVWQQDGDLFGASHRIEVCWTSEQIHACRKLCTSENTSAIAWRFVAVRCGDRWRLESAEGLLFEGVTALMEAVRQARGDIGRLGVAPQPEWLDPPRMLRLRRKASP